jgi:hypothetical protein
MKRVTLRPPGRGNWRPFVLLVESYPRQQGRLFRQDDSEMELVEPSDTWVVNGREFRVAKVEELKR